MGYWGVIPSNGREAYIETQFCKMVIIRKADTQVRIKGFRRREQVEAWLEYQIQCEGTSGDGCVYFKPRTDTGNPKFVD